MGNAPCFRVRLASPELVLARSGGEGDGHVALAAPVLHPLLVAARPSPIGLLLDLRNRDLALAARRNPSAAERLAAIDLAAMAEALEPALANAKTSGKARRLRRRLVLARGMLRAGVAPAWMIVTALPLPPPEIRAGWDGVAACVDGMLPANEAMRVDPTEARYTALVDAVAALFEAHAGIARHLVARHAPGPMRAAPPPAPRAVPAEVIYGVWYATRPHAGARGEGLVFASIVEAVAAHAHGAVDLHAEVGLRVEGARVRTTVGRVLLFDALGGRVPFAHVNGTLDARAVREILGAAPAAFAPLCRFGLTHARASGLSVALGDLRSPPEKAVILAEAEATCVTARDQYQEGIFTEGERYGRVVDAWLDARDRVVQAQRGGIGPEHPFGAMRAAGLLEDEESLAACTGMLGTFAKQWWILELPGTHSLAEGLTPDEAFASAGVARTAALEDRHQHREARLLRRRLDVSLGCVRVVAEDCGDAVGICLGPQLDGRRVVTSLGQRVLGRVVTEPVVDPGGGGLLVRAGARVDTEGAARLDRALVASVRVRSPLTCQAEGGVCARCHLGASKGAPVGLAAAREIARSVGMLYFPRRGRWFVVSTRCRVPMPILQRSSAAGTVRHQGLDDGAARRTPAREGRIAVHDGNGLEVESFRVLPGDVVLAGNGERIDQGSDLFSYERTEHDRDPDAPWGGLSVLLQRLRQSVLPDRAVLAAVDGTVTRVDRHRRTWSIRVEPDDGRPCARQGVRMGDYVLVRPGDRVQRGEMLVAGPVSDHDWLRVYGPHAAAARLLEDLAALLVSGGAPIADVHLEVAVRVMLGHVRVVASGDTPLVPGQLVGGAAARAESARSTARGGQPATVDTVLLGIDAAALAGSRAPAFTPRTRASRTAPAPAARA